MNEEEKQAIEKLKSIVKVNKDFLKGVENQTINQEEIKSIEIALNMIESLLWKEGNQKELLKYKTDVIEKQQKEIEELSVIKNSIQTLETHFVNDDTYYVIAKKNFLEGDFRHLLDDYISKDRIKEKIEEITSYAYTSAEEKDCQDYAIQVLKELLGE